MLQEFHAHDRVVGLGLLVGKRLHGDLAVVDGYAAQSHVGLGRLQRRQAQIDTGHPRARTCKGFGEDAAAAPHVQYLAPGQIDPLPDKVETQRIDVVQGLEFAADGPPAGGDRFELGDFGSIDVGWRGRRFRRASHGGLGSSSRFSARIISRVLPVTLRLESSMAPTATRGESQPAMATGILIKL